MANRDTDRFGLSSVLLAGLCLFAVVSCASGAFAPTGASEIRDPEAVRQDLIEIMDSMEGMTSLIPLDPEVQDQISLARRQLMTATAAELETLSSSVGPEIEQLRAAVEELKAIAERRPTTRPFVPRSGGFPSAAYPFVSMSGDLGAEGLDDDSREDDDYSDGDVNDESDSWSILCNTGIRSDAEDFFIAYNVYQAAKVIWQVIGRACNQVVVVVVLGGGGGNCSLCCAVADVVFALAESIFNSIELCDNLIDSAEIQGSYERLEHVHGDLEVIDGEIGVIDSKVNTLDGKADTIIDAVTCRPAVTPRYGHGCNGADEDCDQVFDDCTEDMFQPTSFFDEAVSVPWYSSMAEAQAAVARAFHSADDCQPLSSVGTPTLAGSCDSVGATVQAVYGCGQTTTASTVVKVDGTPPTIVINPALADACFTSVEQAEAAVLAGAVIGDDCTSLAGLNVRIDSTVTGCTLRERIEAIDRAGHRSQAAVTVRADGTGPSVKIERLLLGFRGEVLGFQTPACFDTVADAEAAVRAATTFGDDCTANADLSTSITSSGPECGLKVTSRASDGCSNQNSDSVTVRVDSTPPDVTCSVATDTLDKGNHKMVDVGFSYSATDDCGGDLDVEIQVTSDETSTQSTGTGPNSNSMGGPHAPDALVLRDVDGNVQAIRFRDEASSQGNGRVYEIVVTATDACGNAERAVCTVSAPKNKNSAAVDDGQLFDPTQIN